MPRGSGRRPKPTALRKLEGNRGKRRLNTREPKPLPGEPPMPAGLSDLEREYWHSIVPTLLAMDVLTTIDGSALAGCCMAYADMVGAREDIEKHGRLIEQEHCDSKGGYLGTSIKANPAVAQADRAAKRWKSFLIEFGMTPASRSRLSTSPDAEKPKDPADKYFGAAEQGSGNTLQ